MIKIYTETIPFHNRKYGILEGEGLVIFYGGKGGGSEEYGGLNVELI